MIPNYLIIIKSKTFHQVIKINSHDFRIEKIHIFVVTIVSFNFTTTKTENKVFKEVIPKSIPVHF